MKQDSQFPTRLSRLSRLKNWDDQEAWRRFYHTYERLIFTTATRAGLSEEDAEEVYPRFPNRRATATPKRWKIPCPAGSETDDTVDLEVGARRWPGKVPG